METKREIAGEGESAQQLAHARARRTQIAHRYRIVLKAGGDHRHHDDDLVAHSSDTMGLYLFKT